LTALFALFGHPVAHSLSPAMQNAAFSACGIDAAYIAFDVEESSLGAAVAAIRALGLQGVNVTIPFKRAILPYLDECSGEAALAGSVNTIVNRAGHLIGHGTDGEGFMRSLREAGIPDLAGWKVCLLGTGGAALAIASRLSREGVAGLTLVTRGERDLNWPHEIDVRQRLTYDALAADPDALTGCDLLINTTPLGMKPWDDAMPAVPLTILRPGLIVYDLIYNPARTRLMETAERCGARVLGGLSMLVHQGAAAFEIWTGRPAPIQAMKAAAEAGYSWE